MCSRLIDCFTVHQHKKATGAKVLLDNILITFVNNSNISQIKLSTGSLTAHQHMMVTRNVYDAV